MVFDLGGGTLDITMHEIRRREDNPDVLKVTEIATNRYTLLGGDDFDEAIAREMFRRYLAQYEGHAEVVRKLQREEKIIMSQLRVYAEELKLELSERESEAYEASGWDDEEEGCFDVGGNMGGIGYAYDDTFTREEVEQILMPFMGAGLSFEDWQRLDCLGETRNIIYPILDVLHKAAAKLGGLERNSVDAVVVNGGMSKFYLVTDRLKQFFGKEPISALDPDQSVARGAAVYHYYLHAYDEIRDNMRLLGNTDPAERSEGNNPPPGNGRKEREFAAAASGTLLGKLQLRSGIEWGHTVLNDSLYLGAKNGQVREIIPAGIELPYESELMTGFRIDEGQSEVTIPIKRRVLDGNYVTIASGRLAFQQEYPQGAYVAFRIKMAESKLLSLTAWTADLASFYGASKLRTCARSVSVALKLTEGQALTQEEEKYLLTMLEGEV